MSLALSLAVGRSRRLAAFSLLAAGVGIAGGILCGWQLALSGMRLAGVLVALVVMLICAAARVAAARRVACGVLRVESDGLSNWNGAHARSSLPFMPDRWFMAAGCAWISGLADGRRLHLLSGADAHDDADWTRLKRWLLWLERGGGERG